MALQNVFQFGEAVTPSDATVQASGRFNALYCGGAGTVALLTGGNVVSYTVPAGFVLPVGGTRVNATGTTATLMVAMYG
jgi:hypothetical protein